MRVRRSSVFAHGARSSSNGRHHRRRAAERALPRAHPGDRRRRRGRVRLPRGRAELERDCLTELSEEITINGDSEELDASKPLSDRLSLGVAARLSRYLQVLTQARKMGKDTISSQELSDYTHINSTQIRRDLSGFGKFGKRGRRLQRRLAAVADPQDPADVGPAQHRAVRRGSPRPGDRQLGHLRRPRIPASSRSSTSTRRRSAAASATWSCGPTG